MKEQFFKLNRRETEVWEFVRKKDQRNCRERTVLKAEKKRDKCEKKWKKSNRKRSVRICEEKGSKKVKGNSYFLRQKRKEKSVRRTERNQIEREREVWEFVRKWDQRKWKEIVVLQSRKIRNKCENL